MIRPWIAAVLSAILPGVGQIINHNWVKGLAFLTAALIASGILRRRSVLAAEIGHGSALHLVLITVLFVLAVWSAVDAYRFRHGTSV